MLSSDEHFILRSVWRLCCSAVCDAYIRCHGLMKVCSTGNKSIPKSKQNIIIIIQPGQGFHLLPFRLYRNIVCIDVGMYNILFNNALHRWANTMYYVRTSIIYILNAYFSFIMYIYVSCMYRIRSVFIIILPVTRFNSLICIIM